LALSSILLQGCLKSRAQLHQDQEDEQTQADSKPVPVRVQQAQESYAVDEIKQEITRLTGRIEDLERNRGDGELKQVIERVTALEKSNTDLMAEIEKLRVPQSVPTAHSDDILKKAREAFSKQDYESASSLFGKYLQSPNVTNRQEAVFYRAESLFELKDYRKAINEYSQFPEKFTQSKRMPTALYKIGLSFDHLGMKEDAKNFYQELVERFPTSPEAKRSKSKTK
jgi:tol-pal system protein YbgF